MWQQIGAVKPVVQEPRGTGELFDSAMREFYAGIDGGRGAVLFAVCRGKVLPRFAAFAPPPSVAAGIDPNRGAVLFPPCSVKLHITQPDLHLTAASAGLLLAVQQ